MFEDKKTFKGKRVTIMGLDAAGRGIQDARFLLEQGAEVIATDLKTSEQLPEAVALAQEFPHLTLHLGGHSLADFADRDFVIRAALAPLDSPYLAHARAHHVPVVSDETLFLRYAPEVLTIGVTGTRGKTTVTHLINEVLTVAGRRVYLGGNVQGRSLLPLLTTVQSGDVILMELDSWKLQSFAEDKRSPHIAVFTTFFPDHLNYYKGDLEKYFQDKASIFYNQEPGHSLVVTEQVAAELRTRGVARKPDVVVRAADIPSDWTLQLLGAHNRENAALALAVARQLGIFDVVTREAFADFAGVPGRLELAHTIEGVLYYNDTTATSPEGVLAALSAFADHKGKIILIGGGADKDLDYHTYAATVPNYVKALILFRGGASDKILTALGVAIESDCTKTGPEALLPDALGSKASRFRTVCQNFPIVSDVTSMQEALTQARSFAVRGEIVLLSPGAASFGVFKNEYDRGDQFVVEVKKL